MDKRWLEILMKRGRLKAEPKTLERSLTLLRQIRAGRVRGRYKRPQDLLRPPRNPAERRERQDLVTILTVSLRKEVRMTLFEQIEKTIETQLKRARREYEAYQKQKAVQSKYPEWFHPL